MQALTDEQRLDALEKKVDDGFAEMRTDLKEVRAESRDEFRAIRGEIGALNRTVLTMFLTMILGFAGILLNHL
jgi:hypothetical protein